MATKRFGIPLLAVLVLAGPSLAGEARGIITKLDLGRNEIVLEGQGKGVRGVPLTFTLGKDARILFGRLSGAPADLHPGRRVRVHYDLQDQQRIATVVRVRGPRPNPDERSTVTGTLLRINLEDRQIVVRSRTWKRGPVRDYTFSLPDHFRVTRAGKTIKLDDLKEGDQVRIHHEDRGGKQRAESIEVLKNVDLIARVRQVLQMTDLFLKMVEQNP